MSRPATDAAAASGQASAPAHVEAISPQRYDRFTRIARRACGADAAFIAFILEDGWYVASADGVDGTSPVAEGHRLANIPPPQAFTCYDLRQRAEAPGGPWACLHTREGWLAVVPVRNDAGAGVGFLGVLFEQLDRPDDAIRATLEDIVALVPCPSEALPDLATCRWVFDGDPHPTLVYDVATLAIRDVNEAAVARYGWSRAELLSMTIKDIRPREDVDALMARLEDRGPRPQVTDCARHRTRDGRTLHVEVTSKRVRYDGCAARLVHIHDVTGHVQTQGALQQSESRYRSLFHFSNDGILLHDLEGNILEANRRAEQLFGLSAEELASMNLADLSVSAGTAGTHTVLQRLIDEGFVSQESRLLRHNGRSFPVEVSASLVEIDGKMVAQGLIRDITERKRTEQELLRIHAAIESSSDAIGIVDRNGQELYHNTAMRRLIGYSPEELAREGGPIAAFCDPEEGAHIFRYVLEEGTWRGEVELRHRRGHALPVDLRIDVIVDRRGEPAGFVVVLSDVTERRRYENELIEAKEKAEQMSRLKSAFLANMSHEIRTPLTGIIGFAEVLVDTCTGEDQEYAEMIGASGRRLMETLNAVLDLAQIESSTFTLSPEPVDLFDLAQHTLDLYRPVAQEKALVLVLDALAPVTAFVDRFALHRVLSSLVSNAIKFTHCGEVTVSLRRVEEKAQIQVRDTGIGIGDAFMPFLFDEFKQESDGLGRIYEGTGLGLAISKGLVNLMGGRIGVQSTKGAGTTFTVTLPTEAASVRAA